MRAKIRLDTISDAIKFVSIVDKLNGSIEIVDKNGLRINGQSVLGALSSIDFNELWCESEQDIYSSIEEFIIIEDERTEPLAHE